MDNTCLGTTQKHKSRLCGVCVFGVCGVCGDCGVLGVFGVCGVFGGLGGVFSCLLYTSPSPRD